MLPVLRHPTLARSLLAAAVGVLTLGGIACGGTPGRAEWIAHTKAAIGDDIVTTIQQQGFSRSSADRIVDRFVTCEYDSIRHDAGLVRDSYDRSGSAAVTPRIDELTKSCTTALSDELLRHRDRT
ncbi:MAG: hypothetical protein R2698_02780 [Microthrixaceae bacterium]